METGTEGVCMLKGDGASAICAEIRRLLDQAVRRRLDGRRAAILLSGGLDTSIIATIACRYYKPDAYTVVLRGAPAPDAGCAALMAKALGIRHTVHCMDEAEVLELIPMVVKVLRTYDPMEVRNSLAVYAGMRAAKRGGAEVVLTGDGADELMAGYSFAFSLGRGELDAQLRRLWSVMAFSSRPIAESLGMTAGIPFLDPDFMSYAMGMDSGYKVGSEAGQVYGKYILRKAFEGMLPREIAWRAKVPIEAGSGTATLPKFFGSRVGDAEYAWRRARYLREDGVTIRDKEHLAYYEAFRSEFGAPRPAERGKACPQCRSGVPDGATFCRTCGAYPI